jgi:hypothetical protein
MDPFLHTAISVVFLFVFYRVGRYVGYRDGLIDVWSSLLSIFKAKKITVTNTEDIIITYENGKQGKLKVEDYI